MTITTEAKAITLQTQTVKVSLTDSQAFKNALLGRSQVKIHQISVQYKAIVDHMAGILALPEIDNSYSIEQFINRGGVVKKTTTPIGAQCAGYKEWVDTGHAQGGAVVVVPGGTAGKTYGYVTMSLTVSVRGLGNFT